MSLILILSMVFLLAAAVWAGFLLVHRRDWRLGFLAAMLLLLTIPSIVLLFIQPVAWTTIASHADDYAHLATAVALLITVAFLARFIRHEVAAVRALREGRAQYQSLVENTPDLIFNLDREGRYTSLNRGVCDAMRLPYDAIIGKTHEELGFPREVIGPGENIWKRILGGEIVVEELTARMPDGQERLFDITLCPLRDDKGKITGITGIGRNITERKKREAELLQLSMAVEASGEVIFLTDRDGIIRFMNPEFTRLYGFTAQEVIGKVTPRILKSGLMKSADYQQFWETLLSGRAIKGELVNKTADGRLLNIEGTANAIFNDRGDVIGFLSIQRDVTERKQAEELLRAVANSSPIGIYFVQEGKFVYANRPFAEITGFTQEQLIGRNPLDLVFPDDKARVRSNAVAMLKGGANHPYEYRLMDARGQTRWIMETVATIQYRGQPATLGNVVNITDRKRVQEQLMTTDRLASIGELAAGVAHEINNPLTGIIGLSELILDTDVPPETREDLKTINAEARRTARIVQDLLTFARKHPQEKIPTNVNEAISHVLRLREYEQKVSNITVVTRLAQDVPEINGNPFQLQQVFMNLVINAEYFMNQAHGKGNVTIDTRCENSLVLVSIADDGPGIRRENLKRIFDPFFTTKEVGKGTGLGLSICHGIITEHGGRIYAESEPGQGASFIVELPVPAAVAKGDNHG